MTRTLWILAVVTLAVQLALGVFGSAVERALASTGWSLLLLATTTALAFNALIVVTAGIGVYVAGKAHRGGWVALFGVALVLGIYGPTAAAAAVPHLSLGRLALTYLMIVDIALEVFVPLVALAYTLRYRSRRGGSALARVDGV